MRLPALTLILLLALQDAKPSFKLCSEHPMSDLCVATLVAQDGPAMIGGRLLEPPKVTEVQRLQVQNFVHRIEIAQLKAQAAQRDFDLARDEFQKLVLSLQRDGYTLNLDKMEYVKNPEVKK